MVLRAGCVGFAMLAVACAGEIREIRPVSVEAPVQCESPRASAQLAGNPLRAPGEDEEAATRVTIRNDVDVGCDTEALGVVEAPLGDDEAVAMALLRARAAKLGADVVLETRRATDEGVPRVVGTAARCRTGWNARAYDVLETIDIAGLAGGPQAAFARLRARAWELHADMVLDVHLKEDGTELTHITGMAVRYR